MKRPMQIFQEMQQLETKEEMISYLRALPKKDAPWPDDPIDTTGVPVAPSVPSRGVQDSKKEK